MNTAIALVLQAFIAEGLVKIERSRDYVLSSGSTYLLNHQLLDVVLSPNVSIPLDQIIVRNNDVKEIEKALDSMLSYSFGKRTMYSSLFSIVKVDDVPCLLFYVKDLK